MGGLHILPAGYSLCECGRANRVVCGCGRPLVLLPDGRPAPAAGCVGSFHASPGRDLPENRAARSAEYRREADFQAACERELRKRGIPFLHLSPRAREKKGWPDLVFPLAGRFVAVELKVSGGRLSDEQVQVLAELRAAGARVCSCWTFAEFLEVLDG